MKIQSKRRNRAGLPKTIDQHINEIVQEIIDRFQPQKIILFGSYAYGRPTKDSDVDLLVIMPTEQRTLRQAADISAAIQHPLPLDILVRKPEDIALRLQQDDSFIREITDHGVVLYEA